MNYDCQRMLILCPSGARAGCSAAWSTSVSTWKAWLLQLPSSSFYLIFKNYFWTFLASLVAQLIKILPAMWETWVWSMGWEDPLKKGKGYPLQHSGLENSMDCIVYRVPESNTTERLSLSLRTFLHQKQAFFFFLNSQNGVKDSYVLMAGKVVLI